MSFGVTNRGFFRLDVQMEGAPLLGAKGGLEGLEESTGHVMLVAKLVVGHQVRLVQDSAESRDGTQKDPI